MYETNVPFSGTIMTENTVATLSTPFAVVEFETILSAFSKPLTVATDCCALAVK